MVQLLLALLVSACGLLLIGIDSLLSQHGPQEFVGDVLFLAAAAAWAVFGILMRRWQIRPLVGVCLLIAAIRLLWPRVIKALDDPQPPKPWRTGMRRTGKTCGST